MHVRTTATLLLGAAVISGCGSTTSEDSTKDFQGPEREVAAVIDTLADASAKRRTSDIKKICTELLTPATVAQIRKAQGKDCEDALPKLLGAANTRQITVQSVTIKGDRATAAVKVPTATDDQKATMTLRKVGRTWRVELPATTS